MSSVESKPLLVPAMIRGDAGAFEAFYDRHASTVYGLLLRIVGTPEDAQEVLQETFIRAWSSASTFDASRGSEAGWLLTMARSRGIDRLRARRLRGDRENDAGREVSLHASFVEKRTGADDAIRSQEQRAVRGALADIPEAQRKALELAYFEGLSQSAIAERLGEPLGTVKTRIQLGMKKLRDRLKAYA